MLYKGHKLSVVSEFVSYINERGKREPEVKVAAFVNQMRKVIFLPTNSPQTKERISKRPFSLIGIYGVGVSRDMVEDDIHVTIEKYNAHMELRKMLSRAVNKQSSAARKLIESVNTSSQMMYVS